ncbi:putative 1-deoxy-D-xylulose-5-phosphate synthase [Selenomonas sp. oral taxon 892 str. F0426]|uniref:1-deoxy-D-xylulose-5-phosphate synthase n=1 Tax=Selenomonas sp. oral taxon 892 TaxID=1321785 RepID=UPI0003AD1A0C|nr:1-deoxy-D-xylulose-5-phosphate synthase [Selenomonas sp. oral taxon 892]ERJ89770.1 putative 1-deoxy-D-xylulose-5-phosphate synthase [Selenomonas sp. oral taxon 892 str. F0426]
MYLEHISSPADIKGYTAEQRRLLAEEMRTALIHRTSLIGGHIGPNLGIIEATIALHTVFDSPRDKIVFDVSHQCYPHKMLTGRAGAYVNEAEYGDVSGFTNTDESTHDIFNIGHTSTAISLASGLAKARDLAGGTENIVALVGDGSMSGGEALEGLNVVGELGTNFIIVFNDNDQSISENHGGMYRKFKELRETNGTAPDNLFRAMGLDYRYVKDGNDVEELIRVFRAVKDTPHPIVIHIHTQKGKGLTFAEADPEGWHRHAPFHLENGIAKKPAKPDPYAAATVDFVLETAKKHPNFIYLSAGIVGGINLSPADRAQLGSQYLDVGIAEEHAVAMASGLARGGARPIFGTYSSFFQRTYDQMAQDVAINRSPAVFLATGTSLYRSTDVTHLGFYDISIFSNIPNLVYLAPTSVAEHIAVLRWAVEQREHPVMIRMPYTGYDESPYPVRADYGTLNKSIVVTEGADVALIGVGNFAALASAAAEELAREGLHATVINPLYLSGLDAELLDSLRAKHRLILTVEDGILDGGFGQKVAAFYGAQDSVRVKNYGLPKKFFNRYTPAALAREYHLTAEQIAADVLREMR